MTIKFHKSTKILCIQKTTNLIYTAAINNKEWIFMKIRGISTKIKIVIIEKEIGVIFLGVFS